MSVVLDRPVTRTRLPEVEAPTPLRDRGYVQPERRRVVVDAPTAVPVPVRKKARASALQVVASKTALFCAVFVVTYVVSALCGNYRMEQSRIQSREASSRATAAVQAEREVQRQLDCLTSSATIEDWAVAHSFRPTDGLGQTSKGVNLVASNQ